MSRLRSPSVRFGSCALALALALGAASCSSDQTTEEAIEQAAEESGEDVDVEVDGDEIVIENSDGTVSLGGDLPEGFPEDDVPLVDGEVLVAMGGEGQGYQVSLEVDLSPSEAMDDAVSLLEGAGFTVDQTAQMGALETATLTSADYEVSVTATDEPGTTTLVYTVVATAS